MKLLTFLGTGRYREACYHYGNQTHTASYAPAASASFLQVSKLLVFVTPDAEQAHLGPLSECLPDGVELESRPVPLGQNEAQLWEIFQAITDAVKPGERVAFDVTHGFRTFPMIGLLAAAFLQAGLDVELQAVLYGAWEARDESAQPPSTPVFDLSPMLELLRWADAAQRFNRTGDARPLAERLRMRKKKVALSGYADAGDRAAKLNNLTGALEQISRALRLVRPSQALESISGLEQRIQDGLTSLQQLPELGPFQLLLDRLNSSYAPLAVNASIPVPWGRLQAEREMLHWYVDREQWVQAVTLGREWLVSWALAHHDQHDFQRKDLRQQMAHALGASAEGYRSAKQKKEPFEPLFLRELPHREAVFDIWSALSDVRNDIDHAGMRLDPRPADKLVRQISDLLIRIGKLPLAAGLENQTQANCE